MKTIELRPDPSQYTLAELCKLIRHELSLLGYKASIKQHIISPNLKTLYVFSPDGTEVRGDFNVYFPELMDLFLPVQGFTESVCSKYTSDGWKLI